MKKMTSAGYRRKQNKKETQTMRKPDNLFCVSMNHKTNTCPSSTINKETVILAVFLKQSWRTKKCDKFNHLSSCTLSCGRDMAELDEYFPWEAKC